MSKQPNKALIGAFVVGAITLVLTGVLAFGSGKFLSTRQKYVMFFDTSVKGLQIGAPVTFRGVRIGEVIDIVLRFDPDKLSVLIPIYVEIDPAQFKPIDGATSKASSHPEYAEALIEKGLKARLELQSLVTGLLAVGIDFYPDEPMRLVGLEKRHPEIPTIPSSTEELKKKLQDLPLKSIAERLDSLLEGLTKIVHSPELTGGLAALNQALTHLDRLALDFDSRLGPLATSLASTSAAARGAFAQAERTMALKDGVPGELASSAKDTLAAARSTLLETQQAVEGVRRIAADDSSFGYELNQSLENMAALSRSLRSLIDYLDRHPEALIKGKPPSKGE
jgi:paraquat-inducible protein B